MSKGEWLYLLLVVATFGMFAVVLWDQSRRTSRARPGIGVSDVPPPVAEQTHRA
jgi:hypothetical protein